MNPHQVATRNEASLHESPVAETVDNARKQQGLAQTSPIRQLSPAGYQRRHDYGAFFSDGSLRSVWRRTVGMGVWHRSCTVCEPLLQNSGTA